MLGLTRRGDSGHGHPGPFIPDVAYRSAEALLSESYQRQQEWAQICAAAQRRLGLACRGPARIPDESYTALCHLLTAAKRAGETDLLFGVLFRHVPIANHAELAMWCRAQQSVLPLYELHYGPQSYHVLMRRPGESATLSEFDVIRIAIPLKQEYDDVAAIAEKIGPLEARICQGPRIKPPPHVGPEPLRGVVHFAWHLMRDMPGVNRPPEPESVPDAPAARRAFDAVIRWCELPNGQSVSESIAIGSGCELDRAGANALGREQLVTRSQVANCLRISPRTIANLMSPAAIDKSGVKPPTPVVVGQGRGSENRYDFLGFRRWLLSLQPKYEPGFPATYEAFLAKTKGVQS